MVFDKRLHRRVQARVRPNSERVCARSPWLTLSTNTAAKLQTLYRGAVLSLSGAADLAARTVAPTGTPTVAPSVRPAVQAGLVYGLSENQIQFWTMIGTIAAVLLSTVLAVTSLIRSQRDRRERQMAEAESAITRQARQVHWWIEACPDHPRPLDLETFLVNIPAYGECWGQSLVVLNLSDQPVHDVVVDVPDRCIADKLRTWVGSLAIGPNGRHRIHFTGHGESLLDRSFARERQIMYFTDAVGAQWTRSSAGTLTATAYKVGDAVNAVDQHQAEIDRALRAAAHERRDSRYLDGRDFDYLQRVRNQILKLRGDASPAAGERAERLLRRAAARVTSKPVRPGTRLDEDLLRVERW
ncbi:hypothetical protein [Curtobacterium flaccumfaciens]|uniref:hypothetical protein n=1 Tax=Curtobacterium flaccumfaciens TaxID=2035 RepID=UPI003AFFD584